MRTQLVGLVVVGVLASLAVSAVSRQERFGGLLLLGTGIVSLLQTGLRLVVPTGTDGMTRDAFFVGPGVYVTLGGGVVLVCAGAVARGGGGGGTPHGRLSNPDDGSSRPDGE